MAIDPVCGMEVDENEALYLHATSCPTFTPRSVVHIQHASILLGHKSLFCYISYKNVRFYELTNYHHKTKLKCQHML